MKNSKESDTASSIENHRFKPSYVEKQNVKLIWLSKKQSFASFSLLLFVFMPLSNHQPMYIIYRSH